MTTYVEFSVSHGPGTLIEHGVVSFISPCRPADGEREIDFTWVNVSNYEITPERYSEFISIHGSERAV